MNAQRGMTLVLALILLGLGALVLAPTLNFARTALGYFRTSRDNMSVQYAVDAITQQALWLLQYETNFNCDGTYKSFADCVAQKGNWTLTTQVTDPSRQTLVERVNNQDVSVKVEVPGTLTAPLPPTPTPASAKCLYVEVGRDTDPSAPGDQTWVQVGEPITYRVDVLPCTSSTANFALRQIVARLPPAFTYETPSTAGEYNTTSSPDNPQGNPDASVCTGVDTPYYGCKANDGSLLLVWPSDGTGQVNDRSFGTAGFNSYTYTTGGCAVPASPPNCPDRLTFRATPSSWGVYYIDVTVCYFQAGNPCGGGDKITTGKVAPVVVGMFNIQGTGRGYSYGASARLDSGGSGLVSKQVQ